MAVERTRLTAVHWLVQTTVDVPADDDWLAPVERETLAALTVAKRRRDWRLGRWTAKQALGRLTGTGTSADRLATITIATRPSGAPYALVAGRVSPWSISISHSCNRGLCAVAPVATALGCDLERIEPRDDEFVRGWFTASELAAIAAADADDREQTVTLFWSAKESALKALGTGLTLSTHQVTVVAGLPWRAGDWSSLRVNRAGVPTPMLGWWRRDGGDVITVVALPAQRRPVPVS